MTMRDLAGPKVLGALAIYLTVAAAVAAGLALTAENAPPTETCDAEPAASDTVRARADLPARDDAHGA